ncbi:MAG: hypothetical protein IJF16_05925 [Clostridia bacterium]|nr:hypothetical protein [Clostridia bacterium]
MSSRKVFTGALRSAGIRAFFSALTAFTLCCGYLFTAYGAKGMQNGAIDSVNNQKPYDFELTGTSGYTSDDISALEALGCFSKVIPEGAMAGAYERVHLTLSSDDALDIFSDRYSALVESTAQELMTLAKDRAEIKLNEYMEPLTDAKDIAQSEYDSAEDKFNSARLKYEEALDAFAKAKENESLYNASVSQIQTDIDAKQSALNKAKDDLTKQESETKKIVYANNAEIEEVWNDFYAMRSSYNDAMESGRYDADTAKSKLSELNRAQSSATNKEASLNREISKARTALLDAQKLVETLENELKALQADHDAQSQQGFVPDDNYLALENASNEAKKVVETAQKAMDEAEVRLNDAILELEKPVDFTWNIVKYEIYDDYGLFIEELSELKGPKTSLLVLMIAMMLLVHYPIARSCIAKSADIQHTQSAMGYSPAHIYGRYMTSFVFTSAIGAVLSVPVSALLVISLVKQAFGVSSSFIDLVLSFETIAALLIPVICALLSSMFAVPDFTDKMVVVIAPVCAACAGFAAWYVVYTFALVGHLSDFAAIDAVFINAGTFAVCGCLLSLVSCVYFGFDSIARSMSGDLIIGRMMGASAMSSAYSLTHRVLIPTAVGALLGTAAYLMFGSASFWLAAIVAVLAVTVIAELTLFGGAILLSARLSS